MWSCNLRWGCSRFCQASTPLHDRTDGRPRGGKLHQTCELKRQRRQLLLYRPYPPEPQLHNHSGHIGWVSTPALVSLPAFANRQVAHSVPRVHAAAHLCGVVHHGRLGIPCFLWLLICRGAIGGGRLGGLLGGSVRRAVLGGGCCRCGGLLAGALGGSRRCRRRLLAVLLVRCLCVKTANSAASVGRDLLRRQ